MRARRSSKADSEGLFSMERSKTLAEFGDAKKNPGSFTHTAARVNYIQEKYRDCVLRMREQYLRNLERKREAYLALETDFADELTKSKEVSSELKQVFGLKARREQELRSKG